ncbi:APC family permease [Solirubrobacter soli]|uniref:APC family permease n=1 Tax=Solirubrobacter soli TaxID=363832 RepID=UPI0003F66E36|nr:APC family permease [Solirubrobacter soli]
MSKVTAAPPARTRVPNREHALAEDVLGLPQVLFCIVTGAAPLAALLFNVPVAVSGGGYAVPAAFIVATVALTIFSVGYIEMARRVTAVGGFYTFITRGLGSVMGMGAGYLIAFCYIIFAAAVTGVGSYFASTSVEAWFGVSISAWAYEAFFLALMTAFAWFHIELTAKILGVALVSEVLVMLILAFAILVQGGPDGFSAAPLNPANIFDNEAALKVFGAAAAGVAIFGAFWSWVGFEMAPNYAEESREPHKIAKRALYISVISLGVFYTFVSYMFVTGWGLTGSAQAVSDQFAGKYASAFYPLSDKFVGSGLTTMIEILIITSSFACAMAFYNTGSRYLFSLAREGLLPAALGRTHPTQKGPVNASMVVTVIVGLYMLAFTLSDPSTLAALLKLGTWTPLLGVLGILAVQGLCSLAIIRYFRTEAADGFHPIKTLIAPFIGFLAMAGACYLLIDNRAGLSGAGDALYIKLVPWVVLIVFLIGCATALWMRRNAVHRYRKIGRFVREEDVEAAEATV